jgi:excisionase family DNA binding protein
VQLQQEIAPEWITYEEAQRLTSLGRTTLWRICSDEESGIEVARVGRAVRINRTSLLTYMERCADDPGTLNRSRGS